MASSTSDKYFFVFTLLMITILHAQLGLSAPIFPSCASASRRTTGPLSEHRLCIPASADTAPPAPKTYVHCPKPAVVRSAEGLWKRPGGSPTSKHSGAENGRGLLSGDGHSARDSLAARSPGVLWKRPIGNPTMKNAGAGVGAESARGIIRAEDLDSVRAGLWERPVGGPTC